MSETNSVEVGLAGTGASPFPTQPAESENPTSADASPDGRPFGWLEGCGSWSRRDFIKGIIASGVAVSGVPYLASAASRPALQATGERIISLNVNGQIRRPSVLPNETLAMTIRYKLGLTGTKLGCDRAECGACTVLIDGVTHYSCSTLTMRAREKEITTVEGLESETGELHPVQQAFMDELGPQCGFCTPGQVMAAVGLLTENPDPTREEARQAMSGNVCRCGAYDHYLNGIMRAAGEV
ncbi:MAG TPA: (2Fe-2S)-binding protein [Gemmatimonadetes bacterium]|nr:(2Fe-2S)-binding protein [Gemmatimonadota bacterium]